MNKILENLYQSDAASAIAAANTKAVDWIVYLGQELPRELSHQGNVAVVHIPMADGTDLKDKWKVGGVVTSYAHLKGRTLVACRAGLSRSPLMIAYYLSMFPSVSHPYWRRPKFSKILEFIRQKIPEFYPEKDLLSMLEDMCK